MKIPTPHEVPRAKSADLEKVVDDVIGQLLNIMDLNPVPEGQVPYYTLRIEVVTKLHQKALPIVQHRMAGSGWKMTWMDSGKTSVITWEPAARALTVADKVLEDIENAVHNGQWSLADERRFLKTYFSGSSILTDAIDRIHGKE